MRPGLGGAAGAALVYVLTFATADLARQAVVVPDDARLLPGLIIEEGDLPLDAGGRAVVEAIPGVRARQGLDPATEQRLEALREERMRIGAHSAGGAVFEDLPALPGDDDAPPRLDSGDPDPERLRGLP